MPLEAVMVCVDNSDYTRNGDYTPTRFESQTDAVNLICGAKTQQNMESSVGILGMAGGRIDVLITPTTDLGQMISVLPKIRITGKSDLLRGIQTAQLALKHRQNKNQKQRIIAFVASPVTNTDKELETLGKNLKKNNVSLDLISYGEVEDNTPKLEKLLNAVNSNESSHLLEVPVGAKLLSDVLLGSSIINVDGEAGAAGVGGGGGAGEGFEFGINPNEDPELALALRISMEEERARQQAAGGGEAPAAGATADGAAAATPAATAAPAAPAAPAPAAGGAVDPSIMEAMGMEDMDEELRQALLLSMQDAAPGDAGAPAATPAAETKEAAAPEPAAPAPAAPYTAPAAPAAAAGGMDLPDDMDDELKAALALSMAECDPAPAAAPAAPPAAAAAAAPAAAPAAATGAPGAALFQDADFLNELLTSLPGVDISDPRIQSALKEVSTGEGKDEKKEEDKKDGDKK